MAPEILISMAYTAMAAALSASASNGQEIFLSAMYLAIATIYLFSPYIRRE
jgi:hypothetical protein